jgi:DnaJ-class molecular chaperone
MPYKDPEKRRQYDKAYKQKQPEGLTKKGLDTRLTAIEIETAEDLRDLFNEVVVEVRSADSSSLDLEPKLRIKLRAVEIGLRVIEITDHEQRIAALEEQLHEST